MKERVRRMGVISKYERIYLFYSKGVFLNFVSKYPSLTLLKKRVSPTFTLNFLQFFMLK
jgi:hypothetical protein